MMPWNYRLEINRIFIQLKVLTRKFGFPSIDLRSGFQVKMNATQNHFILLDEK